MLRNNFINSCRSRKVAETLDDFETLEPDRNPALIDRADLSIERKVMSNTLMRAVMQALEQLPPKFRVVFQLIDLDGRSYDEAMRTLNVPPGTIMSRLYEARALMCSLLPADLAAAI
jgi:RNA polymerase sigma-70 factor (ECF subfamily)